MPWVSFVCLVVAGWLAPVNGPALASEAPRAVHSGARAAGPRWVAPLGGPLVVRRAFDPPPVRWGAGHRGVDLAAFAGAVVRAAGAGRVAYAGLLAGRGVLVVRHGALRTTYEPVDPLVRPGDTVHAGQPVALLRGGHPGPAHPNEALLHWGLLRGDTYLDPLSLLRRGPSRLLPVAPAAPPPAGRVAAPPADLRSPSREPPPPPARRLAAPGDAGRSGPRAAAPFAGAVVAGLAGVVAMSRRSRASP